MRLPRSIPLAFLAICALLSLQGPLVGGEPKAAGTIELEVDARDLPRRLVHCRLVIPCQPGALHLWFPKWIPGVHSPAGPMGDLAGLRIETADGKVIPWHRDDVEMYRINCEVPEGIREVRVKLDTVAGKGGGGAGCGGTGMIGLVNWNACLVYPEGIPSSSQPVHATLHLPEKWKFATALPTENKKNGSVTFKTVPLDELIDSPVLAGEHFRSVKLDVGDNPPAYLHLTSESPSAIQLDDKTIDLFAAVVREACALFGAAHYPEYHFLVSCSDEMGYYGLEHHACSINGIGKRDLIEPNRRKDWVANLLPHEYAHSWCGKYRRPAGMVTGDFHSPQKTKMLWVYEGLTMYLGDLLMVRSGLIGPKEYKEMLAERIGNQKHREGRRWRALEDTAVASSLMMRGGAGGWTDLRRETNDYYYEGMLIWLEADAIIREQSKGKRSLDDFCQAFMGPIARKGRVVPYELSEITGLLHGLAEYDWEGFLKRHIFAPQEALPLDFVARCGYRLEYAKKPSAFHEYLRGGKGGGAIIERDSIGVTFSPDGKITNIFPGMIADRAKLAPGMQIIAVNGFKFSPDRLRDAIDDSGANKKIEFLLAEGDRFRTVTLDYDGGPRYLQLVQDAGSHDVLGDILAPRVPRK